jgi:hypothetical protein
LVSSTTPRLAFVSAQRGWQPLQQQSPLIYQ